MAAPMQETAGKSTAAAIQNNKHKIPFHPLQQMLQGVSLSCISFCTMLYWIANMQNAEGGAPYGEKSGLLHQQ